MSHSYNNSIAHHRHGPAPSSAARSSSAVLPSPSSTRLNPSNRFDTSRAIASTYNGLVAIKSASSVSYVSFG